MKNIKCFEVECIGTIVIFTNEEMQLLSIVRVRRVNIVFSLGLP